ncbi:hypothetical protein HPMBJEAJ_00275 [Aeromonas phage avDM6]|nr:hypothetical protein HPMBJEAJ_00275 [Aeromonas phage avDM6]
MKLNLNLLDMLETTNYDYSALQYIMLVEMKSAGFPIDFNFENPKNPMPTVIFGKISTTCVDGINIEYKHYN